ncbi:MAG: hypothetical protein K2W85_16400 [Phycisphaerales bacterium]|nr:hypothetical protein [Phycisphaerales bacterium]
MNRQSHRQMIRTARWTMTAALALIAGTPMAFGQCGAIKMIANTPQDTARLGSAISFDEISGSPRLLVGAPDYDQAPFLSNGRVYLMGQISNQWGEILSVNDPSPANSNAFGYSVGMSEPYIIVGAPGSMADRGFAYIFERQANSYVLRATFSSSEPVQRVGESVAIDGDYAILGAPNTNFGTNTDAGQASIVKRNGTSWNQTYTIFNNNAGGLNLNHKLGAAVALKGTIAVAGSLGTWNFANSGHGYIKVARRDAAGTWAAEGDAYIYPAQLRSNMNFGKAVATDGTRILVGAPGYTYSTGSGDEVDAISGGAAYVMKFVAPNWIVEQMIPAPQPAVGGNFGSKVAINGNRLLISESGENQVYAFRLTGGTWVLDRRYRDEDSSINGTFGSSLALSTDRVYIGDGADDHSSDNDPGAVYVKNIPSQYSDSCEGAIAVQSGTFGGCTAEATLDGASSCGNSINGSQGPDVWFSWTPRCSGTAEVNTIGSSFDTVLSVHLACPDANSLNSIGCSDDAFPSPSRDSQVQFQYFAGTQYLIRVAGYNRAQGNFALAINEFQTPTNDACTSAQSAFNGPTAFKTCKATTDGPTNDTPFSNDEDIRLDVWFRYVATATGTVNVNTCGSNFDTILQVYPGTTCPMSNSEAIAHNDDFAPICNGNTVGSALAFNATAGSTYTLRVGGYNGLNGPASGNGNLVIQPACPCDVNGGGLSASDIFDFLNAWFASSASANINGGALDAADIFDFLNCWFGGCN